MACIEFGGSAVASLDLDCGEHPDGSPQELVPVESVGGGLLGVGNGRERSLERQADDEERHLLGTLPLAAREFPCRAIGVRRGGSMPCKRARVSTPHPLIARRLEGIQ